MSQKKRLILHGKFPGAVLFLLALLHPAFASMQNVETPSFSIQLDKSAHPESLPESAKLLKGMQVWKYSVDIHDAKCDLTICSVQNLEHLNNNDKKTALKLIIVGATENVRERLHMPAVDKNEVFAQITKILLGSRSFYIYDINYLKGRGNLRLYATAEPEKFYIISSCCYARKSDSSKNAVNLLTAQIAKMQLK